MTILRSFAVRGATGSMPREGNFTAKVSEFLGVVARRDGFAILTLCDEPPHAGTGLLLPGGARQFAAAPGAPRWDFFVRVDGEEPPPGRPVRAIPSSIWDDPKSGLTGVIKPRLLGGAAFGDGVAFVFVMPHEAPDGAEFYDV